MDKRMLWVTGFSLLVHLGANGSAHAADANPPAGAAMNESFLPFSQQSLRSREKSFSVSPMIFLDFDFEKKIINQTEGGDQLVLDDTRDGFIVIQNRSISLGISPLMHPSTFAGLPIGLDLEGERNVSSERFVQDKDAIEELPNIRLPRSAEDLRPWSVGDNMTFETHGAIGFSVGVDWNFIGAGGYFTVGGEWIVFLEKIADGRVHVKFTRSKIFNLGALVDGTIVAIGIEHFRSADSGFSFVYDLRNPDALDAYHRALHGNLISSERIADAPNASSVTRIVSSRAVSMGYIRHWFFGLPVFGNVEGSNEKVYSVTDELRHYDGSQSHVNYAAYVNEKLVSGLLVNRRRSFNDFWAAYYVNTDRNGKVTQGYEGQFTWGFEKAKLGYKELAKVLGRLADRTGLEEQLELNIPEEKLRYVNVLFETNFSQPTVDHLMNYAKSNGTRFTDHLRKLAVSSLEQYFANGTDRDQICEKEDSQATLSLPTCITHFRRETSEAVDEMLDHLREMASAKDSDPEAFVKRFAKFGKEMIANRFTFGAILQFSGDTPPRDGAENRGRTPLEVPQGNREIGGRRRPRILSRFLQVDSFRFPGFRVTCA